MFCLVVPLGSIQELPAESCSEIKASEGNEMVNGDYWIYSDGNGQTILTRCEGTDFSFNSPVLINTPEWREALGECVSPKNTTSTFLSRARVRTARSGDERHNGLSPFV